MDLKKLIKHVLDVEAAGFVQNYTISRASSGDMTMAPTIDGGPDNFEPLASYRSPFHRRELLSSNGTISATQRLNHCRACGMH